MQQPLAALAFPADSLRQLWEQGAFTDVVLRTEDRTGYPCHRVILAAASTYCRYTHPWPRFSQG